MDQPPFAGDPSPTAHGTGVRAPRLVPPPPGTPYHRLARTPAHRWWRPLVGTLLVAAGFVVAPLIVIAVSQVVAFALGVGYDLVTGTYDDPVFTLAVLLIAIAVLLPLPYGAAALAQRRPPGTVSSVEGRVRWRWLWLCLAGAVGASLLGNIVLLVLPATEAGDEQFRWIGWTAFLPALVVTLLVVPFQAAAEEYVFRGWVVQAFGAYLRTPWPGIVVGSAVFVVMHAYTGWGIVDVFAFGVFTGWLAVRTGGLEAAIALHVVNNLAGVLISAASGNLERVLQQGSVPWQALVGTVVQFAVYAVFVLIYMRKRAIRTVSR
jgi:Predicted metal-dependent membrane protease